MNKSELKKIIKEKSSNLGFDFIGFSSPRNIDNDNLEKWINLGYHASMKWMNTSKDKRKDIFSYFPKVKTIISFAYNYYTGTNNINNSDYKISNYAWGNDYHDVIKKKLYNLIEDIKEYKKEFEFRVCVDTSPVMEKYWAQKGGIGWIGKHTNLINSKLGSWFFISEILLDFELDFDEPYLNDLCGTCTRCIEACPTEAIVEEYLLDSNKCISYLTIEHRENIPDEYKDKLDGWIYGCDICQDVCPWNEKFSQAVIDSDFIIREKIKNKSNDDWEKLSVDEYRDTFKKSAIKRTKYSGLKRNILVNKNRKS